MKIKRWHVWLGLFISAVFLWLAFREVDFTLVWEKLKTTNLTYVLLGIASYFISLFIRTWRWRVLLLPMKSVSVLRLFPVLSAGYMANNVYPARAGDILRTVLLRRKEDVPISASLATIIVEHLFDGIAILALVLLNLGQLTNFAPSSQWLSIIEKGAFWLGLVFGLVLLIFIFMVILPEKMRVVSDWVINRLIPTRLREPLKNIIIKFSDGLRVLRSPLQSLLVMVQSVTIWVVETGLYWGVMKAMGFDLAFQSLLLIVGVVNLVLLVPAAPGGLGTFDAATKSMMEVFGVSPENALSYALLLRAALWIPVTLVGAFFFVKEGFNLTIDLDSIQEEYQQEQARQDD
ncbi:MAG: flippase-like domain-containing protein [Chloroflexi bacterium]|nr:flippase-like domain-containing protein [Chloroflexota bacterium]